MISNDLLGGGKKTNSNWEQNPKESTKSMNLNSTFRDYYMFFFLTLRLPKSPFSPFKAQLKSRKFIHNHMQSPTFEG